VTKEAVIMPAVVVIVGAATDRSLALQLLTPAVLFVVARLLVCNCLGSAGGSQVRQPADRR
jgi:hypothetical protein